MATAEPPVPYRLVFSDAVHNRLEELAKEAAGRGDGTAFDAALSKFKAMLTFYPQYGDPILDMKVGGGQVYNFIIRPLRMRYGVNEELRLVFCVALPDLTPIDKPQE